MQGLHAHAINGGVVEWYPGEEQCCLVVHSSLPGVLPTVVYLPNEVIRRIFRTAVPAARAPGLIPADSPARPEAEKLREWLRRLGARGEDSPVGPVVPSARRWWVLVDSWLSAPAGDVGQVQPGDHEPPAAPSPLIV